MSELGKVCEHGQLKRQCPHCENEELTKDNEAMRELLKELEWENDDGPCPDCGSYRRSGHLQCCALAKWVKG